MSARPWYKRYPVDFVHGTMGLTLEEKGAYSILLDLIYDRGGPIVDDARYISGICNCSLRKWSAVRERLLLAGKIVIVDGKISNLRAEKEIENAVNSARIQSESGAKGGRNRAQNASRHNENNDIAEGTLKHTGAFQKSEARDQILDPQETIKKTRGAIFDELTKTVDPDRAAALIDHRKALGAELTPYAASLLGADLAKCPEPNAAADAMIKNGWQGFNAEMFNAERPARKRVANGNRSPPATGSAIPYAQRQQRILEQQRQHEQALQSPVVPPSREQQEALDRFRAKQALKKAVH